MNQTTLRGGRALLATSLLSLLSFSCSSEEKASTTDSSETLRFTAIPDTNSTELEAKFKPVAAYLSETLGVPVEYVPTPDYAASVEMFRNFLNRRGFNSSTAYRQHDIVSMFTSLGNTQSESESSKTKY